LFCRNCGSQIEGKFCANCGESAADEEKAQSPREKLVFVQSTSAAPVSPHAETSGLAVTALVLSFFLPLVGAILGFVARIDISNSLGKKKGEGLATAAIVVGVVFTLVSLLLFLAFVPILFF
jgi:hypothetical protein